MKKLTIAAIIILATSVCYAIPAVTWDPNTITVSAEDPNYLLITCVVPVHKQASKAMQYYKIGLNDLFSRARWSYVMNRLILSAKAAIIRQKTIEELEAL